MKIFYIYKHKNNSEDVKTFERGTSFYAAIFNILWAIYHSMWFLVLPLIAFVVFLEMTGNFMMLQIWEILQTIVFFVFAEEFHKINMKIKGYQLAEIVYDESQERAEYKYFLRKEESYNAV